MKRNHLPLILVTAALVGFSHLPVARAETGDKPAAATKSSEVEFPISCNAPAQKKFNQAVWTLHSFWYEEAVKAFTAVTEVEPDCAMGYWGIAMSHWYPLWYPPNAAALKAGSEAVEKAVAAKQKTDREGDYIAAIAAFYRDNDKVDHRTRAVAYEKAMEQVHLRYPDDREGGVFYSLALVATAPPTDKTYANQKKARVILEAIRAELPNHPGVAHYLIHANDSAEMAEDGLTAALCYADIAPAVPHALHMPSHIFTRLGLWEDSISSNVASAAAARKHRDQGDEFHALDYLVYAYLQLGRNSEAGKIRDNLPAAESVKGSSLFKIDYARAAIRARCALEQEHWEEAENLMPDPEVEEPQVAAISHWAAALGAAHTGNLQAAKEHTEQVRRLSGLLKEKGDTYWAEQVAIQGEEAAGWLAFAEHRTDDALRLLRIAADQEDATEKHPVTPGAVRPARELLADLLMEMHQPKEALAAYGQALSVAPGRRRALEGTAEAARLVAMSSKLR